MTRKNLFAHITPSKPMKLSNKIKAPIANKTIVAASNTATLIIDSMDALFVILFNSESELHLSIAAIIKIAKPINRNKPLMIPIMTLIKDPQQPVFAIF